MTQHSYNSNTHTKALLVIYLAVLVWILLLKLGVQFSYMEERRINLVPFNSGLAEMISNVLIFIPLGIYASLLYPGWTFSKKTLFFLSVSWLVEAIQFAIKAGAFDITDIITNTSGGVIGLIFFEAIKKVFKNTARLHQSINILATVATVFIISMLVLLKLNMLPVRYQ